MIDLYLTKLDKIDKIHNYDIDTLLNKTLTLYYDDNLAEMYPHKKKSMSIALFFKDINKIIIPETNTISCCSCFRKKNKINLDNVITDYFYKNKIPIIIDELLRLYRNKDNINIDELKKNTRYDDLFLLEKYINNNIYSDKLIHMTIEDKINLIKKIISEIIII